MPMAVQQRFSPMLAAAAMALGALLRMLWCGLSIVRIIDGADPQRLATEGLHGISILQWARYEVPTEMRHLAARLHVDASRRCTHQRPMPS
jgi:hypothetical protein